MIATLLIAVVDDELPVRKALGRLLRASKFKVETFKSGQEFLDSLRHDRPDCLVLDLHMPGLSGLDIQKQLAQESETLPIVIITAFDEPKSRAECLAAGARAYLVKPIDEHALLDAIAKAVGE